MVMVPEASLGPLSLQDEATEHLTYRLMKTPCNKIEWHVDLMDGEHLCITEIEELALGSDIIWSMRRRGHELDEEEASKLLNTIRLLLPVASKVSHDPEDEYLTELFQDWLFSMLKQKRSQTQVILKRFCMCISGGCLLLRGAWLLPSRLLRSRDVLYFTVASALLFGRLQDFFRSRASQSLKSNEFVHT